MFIQVPLTVQKRMQPLLFQSIFIRNSHLQLPQKEAQIFSLLFEIILCSSLVPNRNLDAYCFRHYKNTFLLQKNTNHTTSKMSSSTEMVSRNL